MAERGNGGPSEPTDSGPPTVHPDAGHPGSPGSAGTSGSTRTAPATRRDPLLLVAGVVAVTVAVLAVVGPGVLTAFDPRWVLAAAALVIGGAVLATTVRRRR